jgi:hypothetical protein
MIDLVKEVREYAEANYEKGGWDYIVECWSDEDIAEAIVGAKSKLGAIRKLSRIVKVFADRQAEADSYRDY